jgi:hypothetical protein
MARLQHRSLTFGGCLVASLVALSPAAQANDQLSSPGAEAANGGLPGPRLTEPKITLEQFTAFAELVGEPRPLVWQRLQLDPALVPFAVAAADARMSRKSSGKVRTAVGFSIFGVGFISGYIIMLSAVASADCGYYSSDTCGDDIGSRALIGVLVMVASAGLGLGIGIPGIISMVRQSEAETAAVDRYQFPQIFAPRPVYSQALPGAPSGYALKLPLLSFSF